MFRTITAAACIASMASSLISGQVAKIYPVDDAARDPEFFAFRARLVLRCNKRTSFFSTALSRPTSSTASAAMAASMSVGKEKHRT
jgi:hypothetical protein